MAAGVCVLAAASVLATKANKKFTVVTHGFIPAAFQGLGANTELNLSVSGGTFTNVGSGAAKTVWIALMTAVDKTILAQATLKTKSGGTTDVYYY